MGPTASTVIVVFPAFSSVSSTFSPTRARYALPLTTTECRLPAAGAAPAKARSETWRVREPGCCVGVAPLLTTAPPRVPESVRTTLALSVKSVLSGPCTSRRRWAASTVAVKPVTACSLCRSAPSTEAQSAVTAAPPL